MDPETVTILREIRDDQREIRDELRGIRLLLERHDHTPRRLSQADEKALSKLLPVLVTAIQGRRFTVRQLTEHAKLQVAPAIALREALGSTNPRRIGRLFRRSCYNDVGGYRIKEVGFTRDGVEWIVECDNRSSQKHAKFALPKAVRF